MSIISHAEGVTVPTTHPVPESTYRLQFHSGFTFRDARDIIPYLHGLGVTHLYASPLLKARPGSTHGYDIVDHCALNPELGTEEEFDLFAAELRRRGMGLIVDIVPNHMGVASAENGWWQGVLENGPASVYAEYFDVEWGASTRAAMKDKVLLPVLGEPFGEALESGKFALEFDAGTFAVRYGGRPFPVAPRSYALILGPCVPAVTAASGSGSDDLAEFESILTAVRNLPDLLEREPARVRERHREKEIIKRRLGVLAGRSGAVRGAVADAVAAFNNPSGEARGYDALEDLLAHQAYRLSYWRVALEEINYRRFFDVNDLAAVKVERGEVFEAVHAKVFRLIAEGKIDGLRVDHADGLYDPRQYFYRLQEGFLTSAGTNGTPGTAGPYIVAEKILADGEDLPADWPVAGTTGYDFLNAVNRLFVDPAGEAPLTETYRAFVGPHPRFEIAAYRGKRRALFASLAGELNTLTVQLDGLAQRWRHSRDFTFNGLRDALAEVIAHFPVYRSYISGPRVADTDRAVVETAVAAAVKNRRINAAVLCFLRDMILQEYPATATEDERAAQQRFAACFQQLTSPVAAKGVEDTAFYTYNRLVSLNEVGGNPGRFGGGPDDLHRVFAARQARWPRALSPLSTHDTKRSEDVRARLNVLSEIPADWDAAVRRWAALNARNRIPGNGPDANEEYLLYQTFVGAWPQGTNGVAGDFVERMADYAVKALHEAKVHSSWVNPNTAYDGAMRAFVTAILSGSGSGEFVKDFCAFQSRVAFFGTVNSLAQTLIKFAAPGVPDTYQGTEMPDFSLVDPDNRRPVDYVRRRALMCEMTEVVESAADSLRRYASGLAAAAEDGRAKLYVAWRTLAARNEFPGLFAEGDYEPLVVSGPVADHVFAFARRAAGATAVVAVPRLAARLCPEAAILPFDPAVWAGTRIVVPRGDPARTWRNRFTGAEVSAAEKFAAADLFADFPVALLTSEPEVPT